MLWSLWEKFEVKLVKNDGEIFVSLAILNIPAKMLFAGVHLD